MIGEGEWRDFIRLDIYVNKKALDQVSYNWDRLIQKTSENALRGRLGGNSKPFEGQSAIYEMAKEPRFWRRSLCERILRSVRNFPENEAPGMRVVSLIPSFFPDKCYVILQVKNLISVTDDEHVELRRAMLTAACGAAKNRYTYFNTIVGIAIDSPKYVRQNAEDLILMDCSKWTEEDRLYYEEANKGLGFFQSDSLEMHQETTFEFPSLPKKATRQARSRKVGRNEQCPCGSRKKYKHCHGR